MDTVKIKDFRVTASFARDLKDPYAGRPIEIVGHVSGAVVTFSAPEAFSLAEPQSSIDELYRRASMRNGIAGMVDREGSLVCAYTGERLSLSHLPDGRWCFTGGFNPRRARFSLAEFVELASCGTRKIAEPPAAETVPKFEVDPEAGREEKPDIGEELNEAAEKVVKALGADRGRTTVSMSTGRKSSKK